MYHILEHPCQMADEDVQFSSLDLEKIYGCNETDSYINRSVLPSFVSIQHLKRLSNKKHSLYDPGE